MEPKHERIRLEDCTVNLTVVGEGPPVLLLHGWPQTSHAWRKVAPLLSGSFQVLAPDLPGFGGSSHPTNAYDKKSVAAVLRRLVLSLGHDRIRLVGHDVGGQVAFAYAAQWPNKVSHLTLIECGIPGIMSESVANPLQGGSWHYAFNMLHDLPESLVAGRERTFLRFIFFRDKVGLFNTNAISDEDLDAYEAGLSHPGGLRSSFGYYRALPQDKLDNCAWTTEKLKVRTQIIGAAQAYGNGWLDSMRGVSEEVDEVLIPRSGHYVPEEQPEALTEHLLRFFSS